MPDRYVVREVEGYLRDTNGKGRPGLSVVVLDSRVNYRLVQEFRTEHDSDTLKQPRFMGRYLTHEMARRRAREQGAELAARLNEAHP